MNRFLPPVLLGILLFGFAPSLRAQLRPATLWTAADAGDVTRIHGLVAAGTKVDARDAAGRTALMHAATSARFGALRALLAAGADPAVADPRGASAVDFVPADHADSRACELLLRAHLFLRENGRPPAGPPSRPNLVMLFEPTVNYLHPRITPSYYVNTAERDGRPGVDDDHNGFIDDVYGWNLDADTAHGINTFQYQLYRQSRDFVAKLFQAHNDARSGKLSADDFNEIKRGYENPLAKIFGRGPGFTDGDFLDKAMELAHGSHVAGIVLDHSRGQALLHTLSWQAFGTGREFTAQRPLEDVARKAKDLGAFLQLCRQQVLVESLAVGRRMSDYLRTTGAGVVNMSMGDAYSASYDRVVSLTKGYLQLSGIKLTEGEAQQLLGQLKPVAFEFYIANAVQYLVPLAENPDVLFVIAAGNAGVDNDEAYQSPAYLARLLPNVLTVAAMTGGHKLASFSNYGPLSVDLGAPGVGIISTAIPEASVMMDGTSMASPAVAGVAAYLRKQRPELTAATLKKLFIYTATPRAGHDSRLASGGDLDDTRLIQLASPVAAIRAQVLADAAARATALISPAYPEHLIDAGWLSRSAAASR